VSDRLTRLEALRDRLTECVDVAPAALLPQTAGVLMKVLAEIDEVEKAQPPKEASPLDEIRARREARATGANSPAITKSRRRS
jgi:hypothetical protein